ncbi:MAG: LysM peptidoglycan-binding domain-containing protein [Nitrospirae bacterium]|nr:LysM peptidoglycan-binding domain-containing protein [Nitrospirota bacterium]
MKNNTLFNRKIYPLGIALSVFWACLQTVSTGGTVFAEEAPAAETETYTIIKGDTLWDISHEKLQNPFLWPELWKVNPYIVNPDLIYPQNRLVIPRLPVTGTAPSVTTPSDTKSAISEPPLTAAEGTSDQHAAETKPEAKAEEPETPDVEREGSDTAEEVLPPPPLVSGMGGNWFEGLAMTRHGNQYSPQDIILSSGLIAREIPSLGTVSDSSEGKTLFSKGDIITIGLKSGVSVKTGETFTLYRQVKPVKHPKTGKQLGNLIEVLGTLKVVQLLPNRALSGQITSSYDYIFSGDHLAPYPLEQINTVRDQDQRRSTAGLRGTLIDVLHEKEIFGQYDVVYIDRGADQGVFSGDRFSVFRKRRGIGELVVISSRKDNATALVTLSEEPLEPGDDIQSKE